MLEQIVIDVLDRVELRMGLLARHEHVGMAPVVAVNVADEFEIPDPFVYAEQVEVGGAHEVDGRLVAMEEPAYLGNIAELLGGPHDLPP